MSYHLLHVFFSLIFKPSALTFEKSSGPRSLWFRLVHVRSDCILTFQIFHDASSKDLRPRQILFGANRVNGRKDRFR